jgi:predicted RNA-binding Zn ribbon-like protein
MPSNHPVHQLELIGGALCLDLANTIDPRHKPPQAEYLGSYLELVDWAIHAGALSAAQGARLARLGTAHPGQGERVRVRAVTLREALYALFAPGATGNRADSLGVLNEELQHAMASARIEITGENYQIGWEPGDNLDWMIWPVAHSAGDLLLSAQRHRIGECQGDGCGWLFIDRSKPGTRRWCSMTSCGNRAKGQRYRRGQRAGRSR